jgi:regulator of replication initiation timing
MADLKFTIENGVVRMAESEYKTIKDKLFALIEENAILQYENKQLGEDNWAKDQKIAELESKFNSDYLQYTPEVIDNMLKDIKEYKTNLQCLRNKFIQLQNVIHDTIGTLKNGLNDIA